MNQFLGTKYMKDGLQLNSRKNYYHSEMDLMIGGTLDPVLGGQIETFLYEEQLYHIRKNHVVFTIAAG